MPLQYDIYSMQPHFFLLVIFLILEISTHLHSMRIAHVHHIYSVCLSLAILLHGKWSFCLTLFPFYFITASKVPLNVHSTHTHRHTAEIRQHTLINNSKQQQTARTSPLTKHEPICIDHELMDTATKTTLGNNNNKNNKTNNGYQPH